MFDSDESTVRPIDIYRKASPDGPISKVINHYSAHDKVSLVEDLRVVDVSKTIELIHNHLNDYERGWISELSIDCKFNEDNTHSYNIPEQTWVMISDTETYGRQISVKSNGMISIDAESRAVTQGYFDRIMHLTESLRRRDKARIRITEISGIRHTPFGEMLDTSTIAVRDNTRAMKEFYPAFSADPNFDLNFFIEEFLSSRESVILNYGPPGTGKTTFSTEVARMAMEMEGDNWRVILIKNRLLLKRLDLISNVLGSLPNNSIVIMEDMDEILCPRIGDDGQEDGNPFMSTLLNVSDGMDDRNIKFIFNTNQLNLNNIDSALIRPQRRFALIYSGYMDHTQINPARVAAGKPEVDITPFIGERISLAQALSINTRNSTGSREYGDPTADAKIHEKLAIRNKVIDVECLDDLPKEIYPGMRRLVKSLGEVFEQDKTGLWGINKNNRGVAGIDDKDRKREQVALGKSQPQTQTTN